MGYTKNQWKNAGETGAIPINAENLNHMEDGIHGAYSDIITSSDGTVTIPELSDNTEYRFLVVQSLTVTAYPEGEYSCWISFEAGAGITVDLPASTQWANGDAPDFEAGQVYELSITNNRAIWAAWEAGS